MIYNSPDAPFPESPRYLDNASTKFRCYADRTLNISLAKGSCDTLCPLGVGISAPDIIAPDFSVFPNPAYSRVTIKKLPALPAKTTITLTNITGKVMKRAMWEAHKESIDMDLSSMCNGLYFLRLSNDNHFYQQKIVIQR